MPTKPLSMCKSPLCNSRALRGMSGYCPAHYKQHAKAIESNRGTAQERGYTKRWGRARAAYLAKHPLCVECLKDNRPVPATVVDHITPHKGDQSLFWDETNWQALCKTCHDAKTVREDGGFGHQGKEQENNT